MTEHELVLQSSMGNKYKAANIHCKILPFFFFFYQLFLQQRLVQIQSMLSVDWAKNSAGVVTTWLVESLVVSDKQIYITNNKDDTWTFIWRM